MALTPITREEYYLAKAGGQDVPTPSPVPREEQYLAKLSGQDVNVPTPITRREKFLYAASGGDIDLPSEDKMRRIEKFMAKAGGRDVTTPTPVPREEQFWDAIIAESGIKTLTGRLPLFFKTTETKLRDWVIYGNNDVGKNLLRLPTEEKTNNGVTFAVNEATGTITTNGTSTDSSIIVHSVTLEPGNYIFTCDNNAQRDRTYDSYIRYLDATIARDNDTDAPGNAFTLTETASVRVVNRLWKGNGDTPHVFKPMLRKTGTSAAFEPYQIGVGERTENGYVLNIGVGFAPISEPPAAHLYSSKTINLGESPLTEGRTVSMSEFGDIIIVPYSDVFIAAVKTYDLESPLSYNQPEMKIKYKE